MAAKIGQFGQLVRTLGSQLKEALSSSLGQGSKDLEPYRTPRAAVVAKVSRNAVAELVNQARNHPQRGDSSSANPAYVALAELADLMGKPGLALGLRNETGEISFLDMEMDPETARQNGGPYVEPRQNRNLWRQLKHLSSLKVDRTMLAPSLPIKSPEETDLPEELVEEDEN
ncbi:MAG: hypothetical protein LBO66_08745 [Deltaproteobacteria bacterium]|nr:hypothetical protein [Deltaproteobacteria bacterium]